MRIDLKFTPQKFQFVLEINIRKNLFQLTRQQTSSLREKLPQGIYWTQIPGGRLYHWNWTLLQDYLLKGDCLEHQDLVEEYLALHPNVRQPATRSMRIINE
jgi:hypothetical protein